MKAAEISRVTVIKSRRGAVTNQVGLYPFRAPVSFLLVLYQMDAQHSFLGNKEVDKVNKAEK